MSSGDTAVLLSSGLPIRQALLMNFLSSCGAYPGFLLGAKLGSVRRRMPRASSLLSSSGELENFHPWICALAGGMFVYIGLTDMVSFPPSPFTLTGHSVSLPDSRTDLHGQRN